MVVEYDQELLAPIGVVRDREQLRGRDVIVIEGGGAVMLVPKEGGGDPRCASVCMLVYVCVCHVFVFASCVRCAVLMLHLSYFFIEAYAFPIAYICPR